MSEHSCGREDYDFDSIVGQKHENWVVPIKCRICGFRSYLAKRDYDDKADIAYDAFVKMLQEEVS